MIKRGKLGSLRVDNPVGLHQVSPSPDGESVSTVIIDLKVAEDEIRAFLYSSQSERNPRQSPR